MLYSPGLFTFTPAYVPFHYNFMLYSPELFTFIPAYVPFHYDLMLYSPGLFTLTPAYVPFHYLAAHDSLFKVSCNLQCALDARRTPQGNTYPRPALYKQQ
jgi:hypothetical protein